MSEIWKSPCGRMELRKGEWHTALQDIEHCDSAIWDAPYSAKTHEGRRTGSETRKSGIHYASLTRDDAWGTMLFLAERVSGWFVAFGDDETQSWWREQMDARDLYVFNAVAWCKPDAAPRQSGDGPASATEWLSIARTKHFPKRMGSRPGYYSEPTSSTRGRNGDKGFPGEKPLGLMRKIVRDYSEPGDLILDPYAGRGTTLLAAAIEGRYAIGAESIEETYHKAVKRLSAGYTPAMTFGKPAKQKQEAMF